MAAIKASCSVEQKIDSCLREVMLEMRKQRIAHRPAKSPFEQKKDDFELAVRTPSWINDKAFGERLTS